MSNGGHHKKLNTTLHYNLLDIAHFTYVTIEALFTGPDRSGAFRFRNPHRVMLVMSPNVTLPAFWLQYTYLSIHP